MGAQICYLGTNACAFGVCISWFALSGSPGGEWADRKVAQSLCANFSYCHYIGEQWRAGDNGAPGRQTGRCVARPGELSLRVSDVLPSSTGSSVVGDAPGTDVREVRMRAGVVLDRVDGRYPSSGRTDCSH